MRGGNEAIEKLKERAEEVERRDGGTRILEEQGEDLEWRVEGRTGSCWMCKVERKEEREEEREEKRDEIREEREMEDA